MSAPEPLAGAARAPLMPLYKTARNGAGNGALIGIISTLFVYTVGIAVAILNPESQKGKGLSLPLTPYKLPELPTDEQIQSFTTLTAHVIALPTFLLCAFELISRGLCGRRVVRADAAHKE